MKEDTNRIDYSRKKYGKKELREYREVHQIKCANCGYKFPDIMKRCPVCDRVKPV